MQYTFNVNCWGDYKFPYTCTSNDMRVVKKNAAAFLGCHVDNLELVDQKTDLQVLESKLPKELYGWAFYYAYQKGHAYGEDEIYSILQDIVEGLSEAVTKFKKRTCDGGKIDSIHFPND